MWIRVGRGEGASADVDNIKILDIIIKSANVNKGGRGNA